MFSAFETPALPSCLSGTSINESEKISDVQSGTYSSKGCNSSVELHTIQRLASQPADSAMKNTSSKDQASSQSESENLYSESEKLDFNRAVVMYDIQVVDAITEQLEQIEIRFQNAEKSFRQYGTPDPDMMDKVLNMKATVNQMNFVVNKLADEIRFCLGSLSESVSDSELDTKSFAASLSARASRIQNVSEEIIDFGYEENMRCRRLVTGKDQIDPQQESQQGL